MTTTSERLWVYRIEGYALDDEGDLVRCQVCRVLGEREYVEPALREHVEWLARQQWNHMFPDTASICGWGLRTTTAPAVAAVETPTVADPTATAILVDTSTTDPLPDVRTAAGEPVFAQSETGGPPSAYTRDARITELNREIAQLRATVTAQRELIAQLRGVSR